MLVLVLGAVGGQGRLVVVGGKRAVVGIGGTVLLPSTIYDYELQKMYQ